MYKYLLFAGTTEGRQIAGYLKTQSDPACVFAATEYGGELIEASDSLTVVTGRMDLAAMEACFRKNKGALVIDATHPYAAEVSRSLRTAAARTGNPYWRVLRSSEPEAAWKNDKNIFTVRSVKEAVSFLAGTTGRVLLTTGSKNLKEFAALPDYTSRVYARVLSVTASAILAEETGLKGDHLICMQGPFSAEMNLACIHHVQAEWLVTKETGQAGGFPEKLSAAEAAGCRVLVILRPVEESGMTPEECISRLQKKDAGLPEAVSFDNSLTPEPPFTREIALVGCGTGRDMTVQAAEWCRTSDLLIGAKRIVESIPHNHAETMYEYRREAILDFLKADRRHRKVAVLFSGDTGFFSGAAAFRREIADGSVRCFPGISSLSAFSAKLGIPWQEAKIISIHGRSANVITNVRKNRLCFCLLGKPDDVRSLSRSLMAYHLETVRLYVGERLGEAEERITSGCPADFLEFVNDPVCVLFLENNSPDTVIVPGIPDEAFLRGNVPMTKEEVRTLAISKMRLSADHIVYDIGAGTGSISVEMARMIPDGRVYAIEVNPEGIDLIRQNAGRFGTDNLTVIEGHAPEALTGLPAPDAALIGGSKGTAGEVIRLLLEKNPSVRIVVTAITLETVSAVLETLRAYKNIRAEVIQVTTARSRSVGNNHMMMGQNPIFIISFGGQDLFFSL